MNTLFVLIAFLSVFELSNSLILHRRRDNVQQSSFRLLGGGVLRGDTLPKIIQLTEGMQLGVKTTNSEDIKKLIDEIGDKNFDFMENDIDMKAKISGEWELIWTTEKETLFFAQNGLFGSKVKKIIQSIDTATRTLKNIIEFDDGREFNVTGVLSDDAKKRTRVIFKFKSATLKIPPIPSLSLPPVGQGWFDNLYVNNKYRLSRDIRGDYLISRRIE